MTRFSDIERDQERAVERALQQEAAARGARPPSDLLQRVAQRTAKGLATADDTRALQAVFGTQPPLALVAFDTPGIQDYIFKATRPVDIYGASKRIADFTADPPSPGSEKFAFHRLCANRDLPRGAVIYAGGGGGLLLVAASQAEDVAKEIGDLLAGATGNDLQSVTAVLEVWPEDLAATPADAKDLNDILGPKRATTRYGATVQVLMARRLRQRSLAERLTAEIPGKENVRRCTTCGSRPGQLKEHPDGQREFLCQPCDDRRGYGARGKKFDQAKSFRDLVDDKDEDKAIAVLYADGANVGRAFQSLATMAQHRVLSLAVDEAFSEARRKAAAHSSLLQGEKERVRIQTPICGGDDLILVLPAKAAFAAARSLMDSVEASFDLKKSDLLRDAFADPSELRDRIASFGVGVGIAIADYDFPIEFLLTYAEELLKSAKRRIRPQNGCRSAVDFLVLTSGTPLNTAIQDLRDAHYVRKSTKSEPGLRLTERPYSRDDFSCFLDRAIHLAQVAPSQVHAVRQELRRGYFTSRNFWRYQQARGGEWERYRGKTALAKVDELLWRSCLGPKGEEGWMSTDFLDAVEILSYLPGAKTEKEAA